MDHGVNLYLTYGSREEASASFCRLHKSFIDTGMITKDVRHYGGASGLLCELPLAYYGNEPLIATFDTRCAVQISGNDGKQYPYVIKLRTHIETKANSVVALLIVEGIDIDPHEIYCENVDRKAADFAYQLCKEIFYISEADCAYASPIEWWIDFDETVRQWIFKFTRRGPQYLIGALEENRKVIPTDFEWSEIDGNSDMHVSCYKGTIIVNESAKIMARSRVGIWGTDADNFKES